MRSKIFFFAYLFFTTLNVYPQWTWRNPLPQGNELDALWFIDSNTGYAAGRVGTIIKTTDGGQSWVIRNQLDQGNYLHFNGICFPGISTGYSVDYFGSVYKTTDEGNSWTEIYFENDEYINGLYFTDVFHGFIVCSGGKIDRTNDGGATWQSQYWPTHDNLSSVWFPTAQEGYITGYHGLVLKTTDSGNSWWCMHYDSTEFFTRIFFISPTRGIAVGFHGKVIITTDGGSTWTSQSLGDTITFNSVSMFNNDTILMAGVATGTHYPMSVPLLMRSTDGGSIWINNLPGYTDINPKAIICLPDGGAFCVGSLGFIAKSIDWGGSWSILSTFLTNVHHYGAGIYGINFPTSNTGYAVAGGFEMPNGTIIKTTDGGDSWFQLDTSLYMEPLQGIYFTSADSGFIGGFNIYSTADGGNSWSKKNSFVNWNKINSISFADKSTGVAVGDNGLILRTIDFGQSWTPILTVPNINYRSVCFSDHLTGFATGSGIMIKTVDAGATWSQLSVPSWTIFCLDFPDPLTGYGVGYLGMIIKTTDGGITWNQMPSQTGMSLYSVHFYDKDTGFIAGGEYSLNSVIQKTTDGGISWKDQVVPTGDPLLCTFVTSSYKAYTGGYSGFLFGTTDGGGYTAIKEPEIFRNRPFSESFPNPSYGSATIRYSVTQEAHVSLTIHDPSGMILNTLVDRNQGPGTYSIPLSIAEYPAGVYYYRIRVNDAVDAGKIVLLK